MKNVPKPLVYLAATGATFLLGVVVFWNADQNPPQPAQQANQSQAPAAERKESNAAPQPSGATADRQTVALGMTPNVPLVIEFPEADQIFVVHVGNERLVQLGGRREASDHWLCTNIPLQASELKSIAQLRFVSWNDA
jgi:hypothetical protein